VLEGPGTRWLFASYADELRTKHSLDRRKILQSDWYREHWPKPSELTSDQNVKTLFTNSSSGVILVIAMLGTVTSVRDSYVVLDDPHKAKEEAGSKEIDAQVRAYGDTFATRFDDEKRGAIVIVMQRINDTDLSAHVMKAVEEHYVHVKIEAEAPSRRVITFPVASSCASMAICCGKHAKAVRDMPAGGRYGAVEVCSTSISKTRFRKADRSFSASGPVTASNAIPTPSGRSALSCEWSSRVGTPRRRKRRTTTSGSVRRGFAVGADTRIRMLDLLKVRMEYVEGGQSVQDQNEAGSDLSAHRLQEDLGAWGQR